MWIKSLTPVRPLTFVFACLIAIAVSSCASDRTPTGPDDTSANSTPQTPAPTPNGTAQVAVTAKPNPVPFSGAPITDAASCTGSPNTWFYDQVFEESGGAAVKFTRRVDQFDGRTVNDIAADISVPANGMTTIKSRWCSASSASHTAQTIFTGTDANGHAITATAGVVRLNGK